jgi:NTP pyrophosphatase (non-canonical NTP hydrolase)
MKISEFQLNSLRTLNQELTDKEQITNMIFGIVGETGEVVDILKKNLYQGHELDKDKVFEELGDVLFYIVNLCSIMNFDIEDILDNNYRKLLKRYPDGFEIKKSVERETQ